MYEKQPIQGAKMKLKTEESVPQRAPLAISRGAHHVVSSQLQTLLNVFHTQLIFLGCPTL